MVHWERRMNEFARIKKFEAIDECRTPHHYTPSKVVVEKLIVKQRTTNNIPTLTS
jgi:hypothetical protein